MPNANQPPIVEDTAPEAAETAPVESVDAGPEQMAFDIKVQTPEEAAEFEERRQTRETVDRLIAVEDPSKLTVTEVKDLLGLSSFKEAQDAKSKGEVAELQKIAVAQREQMDRQDANAEAAEEYRRRANEATEAAQDWAAERDSHRAQREAAAAETATNNQAAAARIEQAYSGLVMRSGGQFAMKKNPELAARLRQEAVEKAAAEGFVVTEPEAPSRTYEIVEPTPAAQAETNATVAALKAHDREVAAAALRREEREAAAAAAAEEAELEPEPVPAVGPEVDPGGAPENPPASLVDPETPPVDNEAARLDSWATRRQGSRHAVTLRTTGVREADPAPAPTPERRGRRRVVRGAAVAAAALALAGIAAIQPHSEGGDATPAAASLGLQHGHDSGLGIFDPVTAPDVHPTPSETASTTPTPTPSPSTTETADATSQVGHDRPDRTPIANPSSPASPDDPTRITLDQAGDTIWDGLEKYAKDNGVDADNPELTAAVNDSKNETLAANHLTEKQARRLRVGASVRRVISASLQRLVRGNTTGSDNAR